MKLLHAFKDKPTPLRLTKYVKLSRLQTKLNRTANSAVWTQMTTICDNFFIL